MWYLYERFEYIESHGGLVAWNMITSLGNEIDSRSLIITSKENIIINVSLELAYYYLYYSWTHNKRPQDWLIALSTLAVLFVNTS